MSRSTSLERADGHLEPSRIEIARHRAGLTKSALAKALGVTARTVANYEHDGAPHTVAGDLARALGCSTEYLTRPPIEELDSSLVFFRALRRATAGQRNAAVAAGTMGLELYGWLDERYTLPALDLPELGDLDAMTAALTLRAMWGLGAQPLPNLVQLAESRGIRVLTLPKGAEAVDAFSVWSDGRPYAFLARTKTPERARFDLAHEIGHLVLHSRMGASTEPDVERDADRFASAFLMPPDALRAAMRSNPSINELLRARSYFKTSAMAVAHALLKAGRSTEWCYRQHCIALSQRGFRSAEPGGMPTHEVSLIFTKVFGRQSEHSAHIAELVADLGLTATEIHSLTFGLGVIAVGGDELPTVFRGHTGAGERTSSTQRPTLRVL